MVLKNKIWSYVNELAMSFFESEKRIKWAFLGLIILILLLLFKDFVFILGFILIGSLSLIHNIWTRNKLGFELCTLVTVISAIHFGAGVGMFVGVVSILLGMILSVNIDQYTIFSMVLFAIIGLIASSFTFDELLFAGMAMTILYDAVLLPLYYILGSNPVTISSYFLTHLLFNYYIFKLIGPLVVKLLI